MSSTSSSENNDLKQWDVRTVFIRADKTSLWGLTPNQVIIARRILEDYMAGQAGTPAADGGERSGKNSGGDSGQEDSEGGSGLTFAEFRALVALLHRQGQDAGRPGEALQSYSSAPPDDTIRIWQHTLRSFFSPQGSGPFILVENGRWDKESREALRFVQRSFHLPLTDPNDALLYRLQQLDERIVRIRCTDDWLLSHVEHNPFCIVDNSHEEYELRHKGNGASVFETANGRELIHFHSFVAADKQGLTPFNRFSTWWLLLRMKGDAAVVPPGYLSLQDEGGQWVSVDKLVKGNNAEDFFVKPDYVMEFPERRKMTIRFQHNIMAAGLTNYDIFIVFFYGDLRVIIHRMERGIKSIEDSNGLRVAMEQGFEYDGPGYRMDLNSEAMFIENADYMKIFVVQNLQADNPATGGLSFPGIRMPDEYYALVTAPEENILYSVTIGLRFKEPKQLAAFKHQWILVAGTGQPQLPPKQRLMCEALGKALAERGYGLINGGWPGVDNLVTASFMQSLPPDSETTAPRLFQVLEPDRAPSHPEAEVKEARDFSHWQRIAFERAHAMILIGGEGGTYETFYLAWMAGIPIIPIPATGGDAEKAYRYLATAEFPSLRPEDFEKLEAEVDSPDAARQMAALIVEILEFLPPRRFKL